MAIYSFFATVHVDRFPDLATLIGSHMVVIEPYSTGPDQTVQVHIKGDANVTRPLDRAVQQVKDVLASPLVLEVAE